MKDFCGVWALMKKNTLSAGLTETRKIQSFHQVCDQAPTHHLHLLHSFISHQPPPIWLGLSSVRMIKILISVPGTCPESWGETSAGCLRELRHTAGRRCGSSSPRGSADRSSTSPAGSATRSRPRRRSEEEEQGKNQKKTSFMASISAFHLHILPLCHYNKLYGELNGN